MVGAAADPRDLGRCRADPRSWQRAGTIYGGSAQIQRNILAERVLGLPRR